MGRWGAEAGGAKVRTPATAVAGVAVPGPYFVAWITCPSSMGEPVPYG